MVPAPQTFASKADADAFLSTVRTDTMRGTWIDPSAGTITFGDYAGQWLKAGGTRGGMRSTTAAKYAGLLDRHLLPAFGATPLNKISPPQVSAWHSALAVKHPSTAAGAYRLLATIMRTAVRDELVMRSPCKISGASKERTKERPLIKLAELQAAVDATPERYRCALLLAAWCQLRRSEILGLQRRDIDLESQQVNVERAWVVTQDGRRELNATKSEAGDRKPYMPRQLVEAMTAHLASFVGPEPDAWLFPNAAGTAPLLHRTFSRVWERARVAAGRPDLHLHDLRHSGLTWVAQSGASIAELMRRGGHKSPDAAMRYQHAADERDKALAEALGRMG